MSTPCPVRKTGFADAALPLGVYALQLALNAAWTPLRLR